MQFTSIEFILFLLIAVLFSTFLKGKAKSAVLVFLSLYFAAVISEIAVVVLFLLAIIFTILNSIFRKKLSPGGKKKLVIISIAVVILNLLLFKYFSLIAGPVAALTGRNLQSPIDKLMPLGISYFSFMLIAYFLDVYNERLLPERSPVNFLLYILYFPKLISGPIERGSSFIPQINSVRELDYGLFMKGIKLFVWGFFLKSVIADRLSYPVDKVFSSPAEFSPFQVLLGILFFTIQLYADFGGYTFMALGASSMLGIELTNNFRTPFFSKSVSEFWTRWHITLSSWLRDYIFLPLSIVLKRKESGIFKILNGDKTVYVISSLATMSLCGIWHGPRTTFFIWGLLHGIFLSASFLTKKARTKFIKNAGLKNSKYLLPFFRTVFIFALVVFSFVFFKADSIETSFRVLSGLYGHTDFSVGRLFILKQEAFIALAAILIMLMMDYMLYRKNRNREIYGMHDLLGSPVIIFLIILIVLFGKFNTTDFIYFRF